MNLILSKSLPCIHRLSTKRYIALEASKDGKFSLTSYYLESENQTSEILYQFESFPKSKHEILNVVPKGRLTNGNVYIITADFNILYSALLIMIMRDVLKSNVDFPGLEEYFHLVGFGKMPDATKMHLLLRYKLDV